MGKKDYPPIRAFEDALAEGWAMCERFRYFQVAALLDDDGHVVDMTAFTSRRRHTPDTALDWARCAVTNHAQITRMVLFSHVVEARHVREEDIEMFRRMRELFGNLDVEVLDWIQLNKEHAQSLAFATGVGTWDSTPSGDPAPIS